MRNNRFFLQMILGVFVLLFFSKTVLAQKRIEKLESDDDVVKFVKAYFLNTDEPDPIWRDFQLVDGSEWKGLYNLNQSLEDSLSKLQVNKWQTVDFNQDKKLDLVVCGKLPHGASGNEYILLAFISNEDGDYNFRSLVPEEYQTYPYYFSIMILPKINVPGIRLVKWFPDINNESPNGHPFTVDTLGFAQEYLVNYNADPDSAVFKNVRFESLNYDGKKTIVTIENLDKGTVSPFTIVSYDKGNDSTVVNGKITMEYYAQLLSSINYSGFKKMPNQFQSNTNGAQTFILNVDYADGSSKKLEDYSGNGTYTLAAIYSWYAWLIDYSNTSLQQRRSQRNRTRSPF